MDTHSQRSSQEQEPNGLMQMGGVSAGQETSRIDTSSTDKQNGVSLDSEHQPRSETSIFSAIQEGTQLGATKCSPSMTGKAKGDPSSSMGRDKQDRDFSFVLETLETDNIPEYVEKHEHSLTFPEKLMLMLTYVERVQARGRKKKTTDVPIRWVDNGTAIEIRDKDDFLSNWMPRFFRGSARFSSFTRKLYRWGFRKVNPGNTVSSSCPTGDGDNMVVSSPVQLRQRGLIFVNENFRRNKPEQLSNMRSVTAAKTRAELIHATKKWGGLAFGGPSTVGGPQVHQPIGAQPLIPTSVSSSPPNDNVDLSQGRADGSSNLLDALVQEQLRLLWLTSQDNSQTALPPLHLRAMMPKSPLNQFTSPLLQPRVPQESEQSQTAISLQQQQEQGAPPVRDQQASSLVDLLLQLRQERPLSGSADR